MSCKDELSRKAGRRLLVEVSASRRDGCLPLGTLLALCFGVGISGRSCVGDWVEACGRDERRREPERLVDSNTGLPLNDAGNEKRI
ncbi:MAG: hypothetical protein LH679_05805 [Cyanobacteria bacterium CAN_BIN43]|nr:hypothetical protein [Cyanobacteria bacterium CAN_BIN43]